MATDRIDELKSVQFPTERRGGYDRRAVDAYLAELADWLEAGGGDEARRSVIQREMSRVGERTGAVLAVAQESADKLTAEAEAAAASLRADAERDAGETRTAADDYAAKTRTAADEQAKATTEAADEQAKATTEAAAQQAEAVEAAADERLRKAESEAAAKTRGIEQEIADLVRKRRDVVANLEQLNAEMKLAIDGPGEKDLGLSKRVEAAVDEPELLEPEPEAEPETEVVGAEPREVHGAEPEPAEAPTEVSQVVGAEVVEEGVEAETDEQELAAERAERERRRRSVDSVDPPTEDQKLTELL